jgi:hypothetical protein
MKFESSSAISKGLGNALETIAEVGSLPFIRGTWFFVDPEKGADTSDGRTVDTALASFEEAEDRCTTKVGDGICIMSYGNTSADTTSYLTQMMAFDKDSITIFGACAPTRMGQRARIANKEVTKTVAMTAVADTSLTRATGSFISEGFVAGMKIVTDVNTAGGITIDTVSALVLTVTGTLTVGAHASVTSYNADLITVSGNDNRFYNLLFWNGGDDAAEIGGMIVTGLRNYFENCQIVGGAGSAVAATKYSLKLTAAEENTFVNCTIGSDTFDHGNNADVELIIGGVCKRNRFIGCEFLAMVWSGTAHGNVKSVSTTGGRPTVFKDCMFNNIFANTGIKIAAVHLESGNNDWVCFFNCGAFNATSWGTGLAANMPEATASAAGGLATVIA